MITLLIDCSIRAVLIAAGVAVVLAALRVKPAATRHAAWTAVLASMLLLPIVSLWVPKASIRALPPLPAEDLVAIPTFDLAPVEAVEPSVSNAAKPPAPLDWGQIAWAVYIFGLGVMLVRLAVGTIRIRRLTEAKCSAPVTVGFVRPRVLLPASSHNWPAHKLDAVLAHEQEHVRRRDPLIRWFALLNRSIFWFHPLAWWLERKLAALAEEACDVAVLAGGRRPDDYAEYLLDLASSVQATGFRVDACGSAMHGGALAARIQRILAGGLTPTISRRRLAIAAALSGAVIVAISACKLDRAPQDRAPGQPTMNELMHRRAAERKAEEEKMKKLREEAGSLWPEQVRALEEQLKRDRAATDTRRKLLLHYQLNNDFKNRSRHALWAAENDPEGRLSEYSLLRIDPAVNGEGYERGERIWLAHANRPGASAGVSERAAVFVAQGDKRKAEQILIRAQKAHPDDKRWTRLFVDVYYRGLIGSDGPFAQSVREKLDRSNDPTLLLSVAQRLIYIIHKKPSFDHALLGKAYMERAIALQPDSSTANKLRRDARLIEVRRTKTEPTGADRLVTMAQAVRLSTYRGDLDKAESEARELLKLAAEYPKDPDVGDAIFQAKMTLGKVALRRADRRTSARYLLEAAATPGSNVLKHDQIPMELPRSLVDWGERATVAEFLERCAKVNVRRDQLLAWATDIRRGVNPDLIPMMTGCAQEPC